MPKNRSPDSEKQKEPDLSRTAAADELLNLIARMLARRWLQRHHSTATDKPIKKPRRNKGV